MSFMILPFCFHSSERHIHIFETQTFDAQRPALYSVSISFMRWKKICNIVLILCMCNILMCFSSFWTLETCHTKNFAQKCHLICFCEWKRLLFSLNHSISLFLCCLLHKPHIYVINAVFSAFCLLPLLKLVQQSAREVQYRIPCLCVCFCVHHSFTLTIWYKLIGIENIQHPNIFHFHIQFNSRSESLHQKATSTFLPNSEKKNNLFYDLINFIGELCVCAHNGTQQTNWAKCFD